jgi:hypothetical protein
MTWKPITSAPRNGSWIDLGHTEFGFTEKGRWGLHQATGTYRWVDGHGNGIFDATHWDYPRVPPKNNALTMTDRSKDPWWVEHDDNGEAYTISDRPDLLKVGTQRVLGPIGRQPSRSGLADRKGRYRTHTAGELRKTDT